MQNQSIIQNLPTVEDNQRECPSCQEITLSGMPGGKDAICKNCGYKDSYYYD